MNKQSSPDNRKMIDKKIVNKIITDGINDYIISRYSKIPEFLDKHFSITGAWRLHKKGFGRDLYRAPINIAKIIPKMLDSFASKHEKNFKNKKPLILLKKLVTPMETDVQKQLEWLLYTEFLELPLKQENRASPRDRLLEYILAQPDTVKLFDAILLEINMRSQEFDFKLNLEQKLSEYYNYHDAASDMASHIITLAISYSAWHKKATGVLTLGNTAAEEIARQNAISNFGLGENLGSLYYKFARVSPGIGLKIMTGIGAFFVISLLSAVSGIVTDPLQKSIGMQERRLKKLLGSLHEDLMNGKAGQYSIYDIYCAKIFDIIDGLNFVAQILIKKM